MKIDSLSFADKWVAAQQALGNNVRWDGWVMVFFRAARGAFYNGGVQRDGVWGYETRVEVSNKGHWNIPRRLVVA